MPTGYTHEVCEGKITEFPDFAMSCARAFGALIVMRDDPSDALIPQEFKPETKYYDEREAADMKRLGEVQAMTNAEANEAARAEYEQEMASRKKYLADKEAEGDRLNAMIAKVRAWEPPSKDHIEMKSFMLEQLRISLPGNYMPRIPEMLDGKAWRKKEINRLAESVASSRKSRASEIERTEGRNAWLKALRDSLRQPIAA